MYKMPNEFQTERLLLRKPLVSDASAIFDEYAADPEVTRYMTWVPHKGSGTVSAFLQELEKRRNEGTEFSWVITMPDEDRPFGMIGARVRGHMIDLGYVLTKRLWNQGLMSEAITMVSDWMLTQPEIYRVWAVCDTENIGSVRVLVKSGFEREGLLRRWLIHPNLSAEPRDCYIYGRVR